jgi:DNA-binding LacI/PurR family transcriptional regulator
VRPQASPGLLRRGPEADADFAAHDVLYGEWSERWGREAVRVVLGSTPDVDAIFCGSDQIARGVTDALRLTGKRVPEDIAVVGYDIRCRRSRNSALPRILGSCANL